ncbi:hypothetical protein PpBr36_08427 [Pyricularia pennisetigena]|uniref:hypothetical protein n=1 Tax=Pyricularia pennisetigena TaxID=1578925 RepID=UPI0011513157|nr:hypothetical protein PpBr36_08427 [Pyricularia pennisetigena]TLS24343.1 hypothetical protein PpBr36_08427 [Pyricularia pennisetigena]
MRRPTAWGRGRFCNQSYGPPRQGSVAPNERVLVGFDGRLGLVVLVSTVRILWHLGARNAARSPPSLTLCIAPEKVHECRSVNVDKANLFLTSIKV